MSVNESNNSTAVLQFCCKSKPWYNATVLYLSIQESQPGLPKYVRQYRIKFENAAVCFGCGFMSFTHKSALRWLLIIAGDVELNPGPINYDIINNDTLKNVLLTFHMLDPDFKMPATKAEIIEKLNNHNQSEVLSEITKALGLSAIMDTKPATSKQIQQADSSEAKDTSTYSKLPDFYEKDTKTWFDHVESILQGESRSEQQRKHSLLRVLSTEILKKTGINTAWSYQEIKNRIIAHYDHTDQQKLRELLTNQVLGDRKPSTALREMLALAPGQEELVRHRFFQILPTEVKITLAAIDDQPLTKLADVADRVMEQLKISNVNVSAVTAPDEIKNSDRSHDPTIKLLLEQNAQLQKQLNDLTQSVNTLAVNKQNNTNTNNYRYRYPNRRRFQSRSSSRNRSSSRGSYDPNGGWCFNHYTHGRRAQHCNKDGCTYKPRRNPSGNDNPPVQRRQQPE